MAPQPMNGGAPPNGSGAGRAGLARTWMVPAALALALTAGVPLFLKYLLACDREGKRTLYQVSDVIAALSRAGDLLSRLARWRPADVLVIVSLLFLLAALVRQRKTPIESRLLLAGLTLLALSAALFVSGRVLFACLAGSAAAAALLRGGWLELPDAPPAPRALLLVPVALGAVLRFYALAQVPGAFSEHAVVHHLNSSLRYKETLLPLFRSGSWLSAARLTGTILMTDHFGLMSILAALGFEGLGVGFLSARLLTALAGTLTLLAAYFMGKALVDERTGLLFAFLLAVSPWHLTVSRYSDLEHVLCPLQLALALGLYGLAVRSGRTGFYALAGVALGLSPFVYPANQVLPLVVALHLGAMVLFRRGFLRRDVRKLALFALLFAAVAGAPIWSLLRSHFFGTAQTGYQASAIPFADLPRHGRMLLAAARQFFVRVEDPWFGKPGGGFSLTEATLLLPGLLLCGGGLLRPARRWTSALLLLALPISLIPGVLAVDGSFRRFYPTATLALLVAARVLSRSIEAARRIGLPRRAIFAAGLALLAALAAVNTDIYFDRKARIFEEDSSALFTEIAKQMKESFGKEYVYVCGLPGPEYVRSDIFSFIRFATYEEERELKGRGGAAEDCYRVIVPDELLRVLRDPRSIGGATRFLAEEALVRPARDTVNVREAIRAEYADAREEAYGDANGEKILRSWRIRRLAPSAR